MAPRLNDWLAAQMAEPFVWGRSDCCAFAGEWVRLLTGVDPMARWRGRYDDAASARAALGLGGLRRAFLAGCREAGLRPVDPPRAGDVGLVATPDGPAAAIFDGSHWVGRIDGGLAWHAAATDVMGVR